MAETLKEKDLRIAWGVKCPVCLSDHHERCKRIDMGDEKPFYLTNQVHYGRLLRPVAPPEYKSF